MTTPRSNELEEAYRRVAAGLPITQQQSRLINEDRRRRAPEIARERQRQQREAAAERARRRQWATPGPGRELPRTMAIVPGQRDPRLVAAGLEPSETGVYRGVQIVEPRMGRWTGERVPEEQRRRGSDDEVNKLSQEAMRRIATRRQGEIIDLHNEGYFVTENMVDLIDMRELYHVMNRSSMSRLLRSGIGAEGVMLFQETLNNAIAAARARRRYGLGVNTGIINAVLAAQFREKLMGGLPTREQAYQDFAARYGIEAANAASMVNLFPQLWYRDWYVGMIERWGVMSIARQEGNRPEQIRARARLSNDIASLRTGADYTLQVNTDIQAAMAGAGVSGNSAVASVIRSILLRRSNAALHLLAESFVTPEERRRVARERGYSEEAIAHYEQQLFDPSITEEGAAAAARGEQLPSGLPGAAEAEAADVEDNFDAAVTNILDEAYTQAEEEINSWL